MFFFLKPKSMQIALGNILKFRKKNWQFDIIGGVIYFILVFSMFPQVMLFESFSFSSWPNPTLHMLYVYNFHSVYI